MLKHQFQRNVFKEQILRRTQDGGQALLLFFGHGRATVLGGTVYRNCVGGPLQPAHPADRCYGNKASPMYLRLPVSPFLLRCYLLSISTRRFNKEGDVPYV